MCKWMYQVATPCTDLYHLLRAASVLFQFLLFGLTVYKFIQAARSGWGEIPLVLLLVRDGTWAFFLLFCEYHSLIVSLVY